MGNFSGHEKGAGLIDDIIRKDQPAPRGSGQLAHPAVPGILTVDPRINSPRVEEDGPLTHTGRNRFPGCRAKADPRPHPQNSGLDPRAKSAGLGPPGSIEPKDDSGK